MIVMLSGKQGSGKSSLSAELMKLYVSPGLGFDVYQVKFADVIYYMHDSIRKIQEAYGIPFREGCEEKDGWLLQWLGTEWGRQLHGSEIWVNATKNYVETCYRNSPKCMIVIDDCRFDNEFLAFPNALRVRLECPAIVRRSRATGWRDREDHPSETGLDEYARQGRFDLYLDTERQSLGTCVDQIEALLKQQTWIGKRV